jgi:hypothetical protein
MIATFRQVKSIELLIKALVSQSVSGLKQQGFWQLSDTWVTVIRPIVWWRSSVPLAWWRRNQGIFN